MFLDKFKIRLIDFEFYEERVRIFDVYFGNGNFIKEIVKVGFIYFGFLIMCICYLCN